MFNNKKSVHLNDDSFLADLVLQTLDELGISYQKGKSGFVFHGLSESDFAEVMGANICISEKVKTSCHYRSSRPGIYHSVENDSSFDVGNRVSVEAA